MKFNESAKRILISPLGNASGNGLNGAYSNTVMYLMEGPLPTEQESYDTWNLYKAGTVFSMCNIVSYINKLVSIKGSKILQSKATGPNITKLPGASVGERILNLSSASEVKVIAAGTISHMILGTTADYTNCTSIIVLSVGLLGSGADIELATTEVELNSTFKYNDITLDLSMLFPEE